MANNRPYVQHIKSRIVESDGKPKLPSSEILEYGEIAVNYHAGVETLSIKNDLGGIATFQDEVEITSGTPKPNTEIWIDTSEDIPIEVYTKEQVDAIVDVLNDKNAEQDSDISELSGKTGELDGKIDELEAKDVELTELAENAYEVQIGTSADTISANTKVFIDTDADSSVTLYTKEQIDEQVNVLQDGITSANEVQIGASGDTISANTKVFIDTDADSSVTLYTKEQIDEQVSVLQDGIYTVTELAENNIVISDVTPSSRSTDLFVDTSNDGGNFEVYTKAQVDEMISYLQRQIDELKNNN